jgi:hypothetical protein
MNTKISLSIKTFFCITAFVLTSTHSFANSVEKNSLKYNYYKLKSAPQPNKLIAPTALTLSYDIATFCAGARGFSKPIIEKIGGRFEVKRISDGYGDLSINKRTGFIDHFSSDIGVYTVIYSVDNIILNKTITVNKCIN